MTSHFFKAHLIQSPRIYLFGIPDCLRGLTKIGKTITPTVKRQIGATTINIDSKDIRNLILLIISRIFFKSHAYLYLISENYFKIFIDY